MKYARLLVVLSGLLAVVPAPAVAQSGDQRIIEAREALRTGKRDRLEALARRHEAHPLDAYVEYWMLTNLLARRDEAPDQARIERFLKAQSGTVLAEQLREGWIRRLARDGQWTDVVGRYGELRWPDRDLTCHYLNGRLLLGDQAALVEAMDLWRRDARVTDACQPVLTMLVAAGKVSADDVWWRMRRALEAGRDTDARRMAAWLRTGAPTEAAIRQASDKPQRYLDRLPVNFSITRAGRELALAALAGVARQDAADAHRRFERLFDRFQADERAYAYSILGWRAAEQHLPEALAWYRAAGSVAMSEEQLGWHARAALRRADWKTVRKVVESFPAPLQSDPTWIYWLGRALRAGGDEAGAVYQYARIADGIDFYGLLAAEELGRSFALPKPDLDVRQRARQLVAADAGLQRALALYRLDMRTEGLREWNWALHGRDDDFLVAAAASAAEAGIFDRAINSAELARTTVDMELRYLTPYRELIEPQARAQGLDLSWVYGLMRQESRFVPAARSSAGAQGLMQVMPATGRWVARKLGEPRFSVSWLQEPENNVRIGTSYMRLIMDGLDGHPVLASAGYNAGPGRARRWRDDRPIEGAIYAETIPFDETRGYVKKVMANAVVYGAMFEGKAQSLKQRLGTIQPAQ
ncbi:MAG: lytic transglycosylase domain-containing protein [Rhodocyclaceae bacterium]|nr:lytic transglycosylase domain-containing protein [Rhodocyclaceae bacterium]